LLRERHWQDNASIATLGEQLDRVKTYLDHSTGKEVTLDELSQLANLSKSHLCRAFKKAFGLTPIQYHVAVRLAKAKQLIRFTDLSLTSIAEELGFHSIHAFSRAFRKREGVSPSLLRK
jgi:AraC-like DNA-binding protein